MNNKIAVIYKSRYGATKRYAGWIALKLGADLYEVSDIRKKDLNEYETIIYGGPLYSEKIKGIKFVINNYEYLKNKNIKLFMVGIENYDDIYIQSILKNNIPEEILKNIDTFYFKGKLNYKELSIKDRIFISFLKSSIFEKINSNEIDESIDFIDKKYIEIILNNVNN